MATKAAERFASLLEEWRDAHTRIPNFSLFLCHAGNLDESHKDVAQRAQGCDCEVIGTLRIPILSQPKALLDSAFLPDLTRRVPLTTLHTDDDMRRFGDQIMKRARRECIVYAPTPRGTDDVKAFRDLADRSGRELPLPIRNSVPWDFAPPGFADRWLAMLFWCDLPDAWELYSMNAPANGWRILCFNPFEKSADTIELCQLDSNQPRFTWHQWPQWAGHQPQIPDSASKSPNVVLRGGEASEPPAAPAEVRPPRWHSIEEIEQRIKNFAPTDLSVLILGESGTGKEYYARQIHNQSARKRKPFVPVNCASLPPERIDAELFGYRKGSFTGADQDNPGRVRSAEGGTIFLDEIGDLPGDCWAKLLRFLQDRVIQPLGLQETKVDVRIIAATNHPERIREEARNRFPETLRIPPLRTRRDQIPALACELLKEVMQQPGQTTRRFTKAEQNKLAESDYDWPGNVRQLGLAIQNACIHRPKKTERSGPARNVTAQQVLDAARKIEATSD